MYTLYAVTRWEDGKGSRINLFDDGAMALAWMQTCISSSQRRGEEVEYTTDPVEVQEYWTCEGDVYDSLDDVLEIYGSFASGTAERMPKRSATCCSST